MKHTYSGNRNNNAPATLTDIHPEAMDDQNKTMTSISLIAGVDV
jgi:hypothetical protein